MTKDQLLLKTGAALGLLAQLPDHNPDTTTGRACLLAGEALRDALDAHHDSHNHNAGALLVADMIEEFGARSEEEGGHDTGEALELLEAAMNTIRLACGVSVELAQLDDITDPPIPFKLTGGR